MFNRLAVLLVVAGLASCSGGAGTTPLAPVAALPAPHPPAWISSISPTKRAESLSQIRIIFARPVTTVGALEGAGPANLLAHLRIAPALRGGFVVFTPHMIGFVPEQALPVGVRVRVTLTAGLRDLSGDVLARDLAWTFETAPLSFSDLPSLQAPEYESTPPPSNLHPTLQATANARVDERSLSAHAYLAAGAERVPLDATLQAQPTPMPGSGAQEAFDPSLSAWTYNLVPRSDLQKGTTYRLVIEPGVAPAFGNLFTSASFTGEIRTYSSLAVVATPSPSPGEYGSRFAGGDPAISFDNPLDPQSLPGNLTISGVSQSGADAATISDDAPNVIAIDPYLLAPASSYTVTLGAGLKDVFGQSLGSAQTVTVHTSDFTPGLWAPSGTSVFPSVDNLALDIFATNLPGNAYQSTTLRVTPQMLVSGDDPSSLLPDSTQWPAHVIAGARTNRQSIVRIPLRALLGGNSGALAYGVAAMQHTDNAVTDEGLVSLTNLGVFAQTFPASAIVRVERLSDGAPVAGASVAIYRTGQGSSTVPCANATTDAGGSVTIAREPLQACYAGGAQYPDEAPPIMAVATYGSDWAYARVEGWSGTENINGDASWTGGAPLSRGTIFTDRQMYQPGESARITGVAYALRGGTLEADRNAAYALSLVDPNGSSKPLGTTRTDAFGIFTIPLAFPATQTLGYYGLVAKGPDGNELDGGLRVAQFKPPNFKLDVSFDRTMALAGSAVSASAQGSYLFGAPLAGAAATIDVTRDAATLAPPGWDEYTFGPQWFWPDQEPEFTTDVLQTTGTFDKNGHLTASIPVASDLPLPMLYSVDVGATDVSNLSVDTTQTFTALASDGIIGLRSDLVGTAGKPLSVQVVVTDLNGKTLPGKSVHVDLQSMTYTSATQLVAGGQTPQNGVQYTTVGGADVTSAGDAVTVQLHPAQPGPYRIRANFSGGAPGSETDLQAFVVGAGSANWGNEDTTTVTVKLDKSKYRIGDTARALVASPFAQSDVYFAVVRQSVLLSRLVHANGNGPTISFRVTPAMLPNAAVEAFVVRRGAAIQGLHPGSLDSLSRAGFAPLHVDLSDRYLKIAIAPSSARLEPGSTQSIAVRVRDAAGHPSAGEAVVMVVDDAILQLTGYRPPDLVQIVFADQPIATRYRDSRENVQLRPVSAPAEKGWGYGGGFLAGAGSTRVRENFNPLAYYAVVRLDGGGNARVRFTLPDELTTWRTMAVAIAPDGMHFGNSDATFIATKTLLTNPLLPQFARPGDTIDAGLSALDVAGSASIDVSGTLTGALTFAAGPQRTIQETTALGSGMQSILFPMAVGTPAPTTMLFSSRAGSATDAFRVPLTIEDRAVTESVVEAGATTSHAQVPVDFSSGGTVQITLANSVVPQFALPANDAMAADPEPFLDDAASRLLIASATASLAPRYHLHPAFDPAAVESAARSTIAGLQQSDGGFALYKGSASDPFETAYAAQAIAFASAHGLAFDPHAMQNLRAYLEGTLANPARYRWCGDARCRARMRLEVLLALGALGDVRNDFLSDIIAQSSSFDFATQARLARYLLEVPGYRSQGLALAGTLEQNLYRTGRTATVATNDDWAWLATPVQEQSAMLELLVAQGADRNEIDGAVRALVAQQCGCGWGTLVGTAAAVHALSAYAAQEHLAPFTATVSSGGKSLGSAHFAATAQSQTISLPAASAGSHALTFASSGGGELHYALLYTYPVPQNAAGVLAGLRVIRTVRPVGENAAIATMDLAQIPDAQSIGAGSVVDIGVQVIVDHPVDRLEIEDPLPAGLEAVDASLRTSSTAVTATPDSWQIEDQQIYADRVTAYAEHLDPGIYEMHYLARAVTPGSYRWPGARAFLRDTPEVFGRTAYAVLHIQ